MLVPINYHCVGEKQKQQKSIATSNWLPTLPISSYLQKKYTHAGLEQQEGEQAMTHFHFQK